MLFKINAIKTLVFRAYHLSSTYCNFDFEVVFLKDFFKNNGFPIQLVNKVIKKFLHGIYHPSIPLPIVNKHTMYFSLPYLGDITLKLRQELTHILEQRFPQLNCKLIFSNKYSIGSFFKHKEKLLPALCSDLIYKFECSSCKASYIGSTTRHFQTRVLEHLGKSVRTNFKLTSPPFSSIREHSVTSKHSFNPDDFKILATTNFELLMLESLYINKLKPKLNGLLPVELGVVP